MNDYLDLDILWKVLVTGVAGGAGLVAVYALGLAGLSAAAGRQPGGHRLPGLLLAGACFLIVAAGVGAGLYLMLSK